MIYAGIDVSKDKHDCCILGADGKKLFPVFTIPNNRSGFNELFEKLAAASKDMNEIIVGLEATGHYSRNVLKSLIDKGLTTYVINPLHTNLYRKGLSLRKTKTDPVDASTIAFMLMTDKTLKPYTLSSYHNDELKSLTRYRFDKVQDCSKLKTSLARLVNILFPELEKLVSTIHSASVYALLTEFPGASHIANCHLTRLTNLLFTTSRGHYGREKAIAIRDAARLSVGSSSASMSMELKHTIHLVQEMNKEISEIEREIKKLLTSVTTLITTIPGISYRMGAVILAEIGDFNRFENADQILAFAGLSPSMYQSGQLTSSHAKMEKRGSKYLRYALFNATKYVCRWAPDFSVYLAKKIKEGKHFNVAISHAAKKLVWVIFAMAKSGEAYRA